MTAPAPITQSTAELLREMRRLEELATAAAFAELDALSDADYLRSAVANLHGSPATKAERYHVARLLRMADGLAAAALAAADAARPPADERVAFEAYCKSGNINTALMMSSAYPAGTYADSRTDAGWHAWQARASQKLARVPLTLEQLATFLADLGADPDSPEEWHLDFARAIERAHNILPAPTEGGA